MVMLKVITESNVEDWISPVDIGKSVVEIDSCPPIQGLSRYLETGCPNRGFVDFCVSKVWYKIHTTNKIDPIPSQILLF